VPLCRGRHREVHRCGDEAAWWSNAAIDPLAQARTLWLKTRPLPIIDRPVIDGATTTAAAGPHRTSAKLDLPMGRRRNYKTKPIVAADSPWRFFGRSRPTAECGQEYGLQNRRWKATVAPQRRPTWSHRGNGDRGAGRAAITTDYDAQSAVEWELVLRLASLLWRLRRATTMETGLFEIQAEKSSEFNRAAGPVVATG
jgi:hypothetical protein